jgi:hypothetical protein
MVYTTVSFITRSLFHSSPLIETTRKGNINGKLILPMNLINLTLHCEDPRDGMDTSALERGK